MSRFTRALPLAAASSVNLAATASSGGGAAAIVYLAAPGTTTQRRTMDWAAWSYDSTGAGGLKVYDGSSTQGLILDLAIAVAGAGDLATPLGATPGRKITVELLQAGSSVTGKLNAYGSLSGM